MSESEPSATAESSPKSRPYPKEFQEDAVRLVTDEKYTFKAAAQAVGVSQKSLRDWHKKQGTNAEWSKPNRMRPPSHLFNPKSHLQNRIFLRRSVGRSPVVLICADPGDLLLETPHCRRLLMPLLTVQECRVSNVDPGRESRGTRRPVLHRARRSVQRRWRLTARLAPCEPVRRFASRRVGGKLRRLPGVAGCFLCAASRGRRG